MNIGNLITGIQHIGIPTSKYDLTISFYKSLGFSVISSELNRGNRVAFLKLKNCLLEVYEVNETNVAVGAINHFALDVTNIKILFNFVQSKNFVVLDSEIQELPFWEKGIRYFSIKGPNNEILEFCQIN